MAYFTQQEDVIDWTEKEGKLPGMINVLTILTFIGIGLGVIGSVWGYAGAEKAYHDMSENMSKLENSPGFVKTLMGPDPVEVARRALDNRLPILILAMAGYGLCLYGAIEMRKRKKLGFSVYVIGEILPIVAAAIFGGLGLYGTFTLIWIFLIPIVFIILYATQLKYLR